MFVSPSSWDGSPASFDFDEWELQQIYRDGAVPDPPPPQATRPPGHASARASPSPSPRPPGPVTEMDIFPPAPDRPPGHSNDREISPVQLVRPQGPTSTKRPREMPQGSPTRAEPSQSILQTLRRAMPERYNNILRLHTHSYHRKTPFTSPSAQRAHTCN
jgi:hypothetical protein